MRRLLIAVTGLALLAGAFPAAPAQAVAPKATHFFYAIVADSSTPTAGYQDFYAGLHTADDQPVAGVVVTVLAKPYGSTSYATVAHGVTSATGSVEVRVKLLRTSGIKWSYAGSTIYGATESVGFVQEIAPRVARSADDSSLRRHQRLVVKGSTFPVQPGKKVYLMRGSIPYPLSQTPRPHAIAAGVVRSDGTYRLTTRFSTTGARKLFVMVAPGHGNATGYSRSLGIHVR